VSAYFGKSHKGKTINSAGDLSLYLLEEALVSTVSGEAFGSPECLRLSYATSEEVLTEAMDRIECALTTLFNS
jgi:aspartate aminotransferase